MSGERQYEWRVEATIPSVWKNATTGEERPTTKSVSVQVVGSNDVFAILRAVEQRYADKQVTFIKAWRERPIDGVVIAGA